MSFCIVAHFSNLETLTVKIGDKWNLNRAFFFHLKPKKIGPSEISEIYEKNSFFLITETLHT